MNSSCTVCTYTSLRLSLQAWAEHVCPLPRLQSGHPPTMFLIHNLLLTHEMGPIVFPLPMSEGAFFMHIVVQLGGLREVGGKKTLGRKVISDLGGGA